MDKLSRSTGRNASGQQNDPDGERQRFEILWKLADLIYELGCIKTRALSSWKIISNASRCRRWFLRLALPAAYAVAVYAGLPLPSP